MIIKHNIWQNVAYVFVEKYDTELGQYSERQKIYFTSLHNSVSLKDVRISLLQLNMIYEGH